MKYNIGVDLGGTNIAIGLVDENLKIAYKLSTPTLSNRGADEVISDVCSAVKQLLANSDVDISSCGSIGVGSPGTIDEVNGIVEYANNLGWENVNLAKKLRDELHIPVHISNDANCAALGEVLAGAAKGLKNAVMLTLGTGVGGGIVLDGKVFSGAYPGGAEVGHTMLAFDGEQCTCGRKGCLEAYASATALVRQTKEAMLESKDSLMWEICADIEKVSGRTSFDAMRRGDECARLVVEKYISYVSEGIIDMINIFRPEAIILGGGIANEGDNLIIPVTKYVGGSLYGPGKLPEIVRAELGNDAGIVGAAMLV